MDPPGIDCHACRSYGAGPAKGHNRLRSAIETQLNTNQRYLKFEHCRTNHEHRTSNVQHRTSNKGRKDPHRIPPLAGSVQHGIMNGKKKWMSPSSSRPFRRSWYDFSRTKTLEPHHSSLTYLERQRNSPGPVNRNDDHSRKGVSHLRFGIHPFHSMLDVRCSMLDVLNTRCYFNRLYFLRDKLSESICKNL